MKTRLGSTLLVTLALGGCAATDSAPEGSHFTTGGTGGSGGAAGSGGLGPNSVCGDQRCDGWANEDCDTCEADCGKCPPADCGNGQCETSQGETCTTCNRDCGDCPVCDFAPTCTGAMAPPSQVNAMPDCNNRAGDDYRQSFLCGEEIGNKPRDTDCKDPTLRLRVKQLKVTRGGSDKQFYCVITSEDGSHGELLLVPPHTVKGGTFETNDTTLTFSMTDSMFWGQKDLHVTKANVLVTYKCYLASNADTYDKVLGNVTDAAVGASAGGSYGWVFGAVGLASAALGGVLGNTPDEVWLDVQQTIDVGALLFLTNGQSWLIEDEEKRGWNTDHVTLEVEAWGCAEQVPGHTG